MYVIPPFQLGQPLRQRYDDPQQVPLTYENLIDLLITIHGQTPNLPDPKWFFPPELFDDYLKAKEWWPNDLTQDSQICLPSLGGIAHIYSAMNEPILRNTFSDIMNRRAQQVVVWLQAHGRDPARPNETSAQRKARKNREAQRRYRERQKGPEAEVDLAKKAKKKASLDAYNEYLRLCEERKQVMGQYAERIAAARAHFRALKSAEDLPPESDTQLML